MTSIKHQYRVKIGRGVKTVLTFLLWQTLVVSPVRADAPRRVISVGAIAPAFSLPDVTGKQHRLEEYAGQVTVLNFWAFWCDTWKAEMPHLRALASLAGEHGFRLVTISVDGTRLEEFREHVGASPPFPVLLDIGGQVSQRYQVIHVPTVVILDATGHVRYVHSGYPGNDIILSQVRQASPGNTSRKNAPP